MSSHRSLCCVALVVALFGGACSVTTPRHGFSAIRNTANTGTSSQGAPLAPGEDPLNPSDPLAGPRAPGREGSVSSPGSGTGGTNEVSAASGDAAARRTNPQDRSSRVGVSKTQIVVSVVAGYSGPFAEVNNQILRGLEVWRDDVNSRGGFYGRRIVLRLVDHKDTTEGGVAACREVQSNGSYVALVPAGVPGLLSAVDCLDRAGFPVLYHEAPTFLATKWTRAYGGLWTPYDETARSLASFVKNVQKDGSKKLGVIHINQAYFKRIADRYVAEAKRLGMTVSIVQPVEENQSSFVSEMRRMQEAGVGNVALIVALEAVGIWRDSNAIGYSPRWAAMILTLDFLTKAARNLASGVQGLRPYATVDTPAFQKFRQRAQELGYQIDAFAGEQFYSFGAGLSLGEGLRRAGTDPTRNSLFAALNSIKNYNNNIQAPITWGPQHYTGTEASFPVVCCDANWNWKRLGPPKERF